MIDGCASPRPPPTPLQWPHGTVESLQMLWKFTAQENQFRSLKRKLVCIISKESVTSAGRFLGVTITGKERWRKDGRKEGKKEGTNNHLYGKIMNE